VIRDTTRRYNFIAAQWENLVYFWIKDAPSDANDFLMFLNNLMKQLKKTISKRQLEKRTVIIFDNAAIHKTDEIKAFVKDNKLVIFTIPQYTPELNVVEHTFGVLKNNISRENLNTKDFLYIIKNQIMMLGLENKSSKQKIIVLKCF